MAAEDWLVSSPPLTVSRRRAVGAGGSALSGGRTIGGVVPALCGWRRKPRGGVGVRRTPAGGADRHGVRLVHEALSLLVHEEGSNDTRRVEFIRHVRQGGHGLCLHGDQVGPNIGGHPFQKIALNKNPGLEELTSAGM